MVGLKAKISPSTTTSLKPVQASVAQYSTKFDLKIIYIIYIKRKGTIAGLWYNIRYTNINTIAEQLRIKQIKKNFSKTIQEIMQIKILE